MSSRIYRKTIHTKNSILTSYSSSCSSSYSDPLHTKIPIGIQYSKTLSIIGSKNNIPSIRRADVGVRLGPLELGFGHLGGTSGLSGLAD